MNELIQQLMSETGIGEKEAKNGVGAVLASLKGGLPADDFGSVLQAFPGGEQMMASAQSALGSGGLMGMLGKMLGGGGSAALLGQLGKLGLSAEQIAKFLPVILAFIQRVLSPDLLKKIVGLLPKAG